MAGTPTDAGIKTSQQHWDEQYSATPSARFWSPFDPSFVDVRRLLTRYVDAGSSFLELGFAPGKYLGLVAAKLQARVSGLDYSPNGVEIARKFLGSLGQSADLRCEDMMDTTFGPASFDTVFSIGLIEHFDNPAPIVARHLEFVKPGGTSIMLIPNYGGWVGRVQGRLDPENLAIHNTGMMHPERLKELVDPATATATSFYFGRPTLSSLSLSRRMPATAANLVQKMAGVVGHVMPSNIAGLSPMIALIARKL